MPYRLPLSSWRFPPFRCRLLFIASSVVRLSAVRLVSHVRLVSWSSWPAHIAIIRLISDLPVAGRHSAPFSPSTRLGRRPRLRLRLRLVRLVSSLRLKGFSFSLGLCRIGNICDDSRMCTAMIQCHRLCLPLIPRDPRHSRHPVLRPPRRLLIVLCRC